MAEVYRDKAGHKPGMNWILIALIAAVAMLFIIALVR